jgi:hypothetical protein
MSRRDLVRDTDVFRWILYDIDVDTGRVRWERVIHEGVPTRNGRIFVLSEDGDTFVIQVGPEYKLLGRDSLNEMSLASPAVAGNSLFIRTATKLYRISRTDP